MWKWQMLKEREEMYAIQWNFLTHEAECLEISGSKRQQGKMQESEEKRTTESKKPNLRMLLHTGANCSIAG